MKKKRVKRVLLVCDRSGGHVYPALLLAEGLKRDGVKEKNIYIFCASDFLKSKIERYSYRVLGKDIKRGNVFFEVVRRLFEAFVIMFKVRPNVVVGFGGRDSVALVLLGVLSGARTSIYEPNVVMGKTNKFLSLFVPLVFRGFVDGKDEVFAKKHVFAGVPARYGRGIENKRAAKLKFGFTEEIPVIGVLGGSQGAQFINIAFMRAAKSLDKGTGVIHICGNNDAHKVRQIYAHEGINAFVIEFCDNMADFYSAVDVLVSRAGAMTLGEIIKFRVPSVLIPYPGASSHQLFNARYLSDRAAAVLIKEDIFEHKKFVKVIRKLIDDDSFRGDMAGKLSDMDVTVDGERFYYNLFVEGLKYEKIS
ncbi:MAG: UDP-N-acetylglucosamine--N-acetylmuramyl-(pentapeptide) pyrophosphoryl-undecaprenol N-acetylglucosamine transferase [Candidatus Omnitrophica bacterium]|nr:UDP-N-acetylglucosamine--N-acetylmuramyl-(pentapeptide) pyrophosphoryl-undecaprenol N-acetylglucosamine transferase [Candidatus Omnitrophota bacterium]